MDSDLKSEEVLQENDTELMTVNQAAETVNPMTETTKTVNSVAEAVDELAESVDQTAEAVHQLTETVDEVAETTTDTTEQMSVAPVPEIIQVESKIADESKANAEEMQLNVDEQLTFSNKIDDGDPATTKEETVTGMIVQENNIENVGGLVDQESQAVISESFMDLQEGFALASSVDSLADINATEELHQEPTDILQEAAKKIEPNKWKPKVNFCLLV